MGKTDPRERPVLSCLDRRFRRPGTQAVGGGVVGSMRPVPLTSRILYPVGGGTIREGPEWAPGQGARDQV